MFKDVQEWHSFTGLSELAKRERHMHFRQNQTISVAVICPSCLEHFKHASQAGGRAENHERVGGPFSCIGHHTAQPAKITRWLASLRSIPRPSRHRLSHWAVASLSLFTALSGA